jgi:hypothetical protein
MEIIILDSHIHRHDAFYANKMCFFYYNQHSRKSSSDSLLLDKFAFAGYAIKKIIKIVAVIIGLFIAALAYLEDHRIIDVKIRRSLY